MAAVTPQVPALSWPLLLTGVMSLLLWARERRETGEGAGIEELNSCSLNAKPQRPLPGVHGSFSGGQRRRRAGLCGHTENPHLQLV